MFIVFFTMIEYNSLEYKIDQYKKVFSSVIAWELVEKFSIIFFALVQEDRRHSI